MLFIQRALKKIGIAGEIFAHKTKNFEKDQVKRFHLEQAWNCDLMFIHHSLGNPVLPELLRVEIPKALMYHNITPAVFFKHDPHTQSLCEKGRSQLSILRRHTVASFALSRYSARELEEEGFRSPQVFPLFHMEPQVSKNSDRSLRKPTAPIHLLFVGRLAPHKNQKLLIETFYHLKSLLPKGSQLNLVGSGDPVYTRYLRLLVRQLGLSQSVHLRGKVLDKELEHYYESADAFFCTSLHEGFCIPLVDAMKAEIPVFFLPEAAIPETMGKSGVALNTQDPLFMAHAIHETLKEQSLVSAIIQEQNQRVTELSEFQSEKRVQDICLELLNVLRPNPNVMLEETL